MRNLNRLPHSLFGATFGLLLTLLWPASRAVALSDEHCGCLEELSSYDELVEPELLREAEALFERACDEDEFDPNEDIVADRLVAELACEHLRASYELLDIGATSDEREPRGHASLVIESVSELSVLRVPGALTHRLNHVVFFTIRVQLRGRSARAARAGGG